MTLPSKALREWGKNKQQRQIPIVVKFLNYKDREDVLRNGKKLKGTTVYVREDLSSKVMNTRREQLPALKEARASVSLIQVFQK